MSIARYNGNIARSNSSVGKYLAYPPPPDGYLGGWTFDNTLESYDGSAGPFVFDPSYGSMSYIDGIIDKAIFVQTFGGAIGTSPVYMNDSIWNQTNSIFAISWWENLMVYYPINIGNLHTLNHYMNVGLVATSDVVINRGGTLSTYVGIDPHGPGWNHWVWMYDGTNIHLWRNAIDMGQKTNAGSTIGSTCSLSPNPGIAGNVTIDDLWLYDRILTEEEILQLYNRKYKI